MYIYRRIFTVETLTKMDWNASLIQHWEDIKITKKIDNPNNMSDMWTFFIILSMKKEKSI